MAGSDEIQLVPRRLIFVEAHAGIGIRDDVVAPPSGMFVNPLPRELFLGSGKATLLGPLPRIGVLHAAWLARDSCE